MCASGFIYKIFRNVILDIKGSWPAFQCILLVYFSGPPFMFAFEIGLISEMCYITESETINAYFIV